MRNGELNGLVGAAGGWVIWPPPQGSRVAGQAQRAHHAGWPLDQRRLPSFPSSTQVGGITTVTLGDAEAKQTNGG